MRTWVIVAGLLALLATIAGAQPDIAVVEDESIYDAITERFLDRSGIAWEALQPEDVVLERLDDFRLVIFPYNPSLTRGHKLAPVAEYVRRGGKIIFMSGVPGDLQDLLGIEEWSSRAAEYPGEFSVMVFAEDRPPGFPAQVHQESPNSRLVTELADHARAIAWWYDAEGRDLGYPAVVITRDTVWTAHVFWSGADAEEQRQMLLGAIAWLLPDRARIIAEDTLANALTGTGYESFQALADAAAGHPAAAALARAAIAQADRARALLADHPAEAMAAATLAATSAQEAAAALFPSRPYELRGFWLHPSDALDYDAIMQDLADANFNAVFAIVCGPNYARFPSDYVPQVTEVDHVQALLDAAHPRGIEVHCWKANWQLSPSQNPELARQYIAEGRMVMSLQEARGGEDPSDYGWNERWLDPSDERNRQLEFDMMMELVEKYDIDGIHFDFMRYPDERYCYCDRCHRKFEQWAGVTVANWPDDCAGNGPLAERYFAFRRYLQTSLVAQIAAGARERKPDIKISLAARGSLTGSYRGDAQDWVAWARKGYLDLVCPMDYTGSVQQFRELVGPQVEAIGGAIPVYPGIGVSPGRSDSVVNFSEQIRAARELGADGFVVFAFSPFSRAMLPVIARGATSTPVTVMPHWRQSASAEFSYPNTREGIPPRVYAPEGELTVRVEVRAAQPEIERMTLQAFSRPAIGGDAVALGEPVTARTAQRRLAVTIPAREGSHCVIVEGEVVFPGGRVEPFYLRSLPLRVLSRAQYDDLLARTAPPRFSTDGLHAGVLLDGYGSEGVLSALRATEGIEALPLAGLAPEFLRPCDVVVLTQPRKNPERLDAAAVEALREFVTAGGGLLAMRDIIGAWIYPPLFPETIAADGTVVKGQQVEVVAEHPITVGLGKGLMHAHTDHLPLAPGTDATVLMATPEGRPIVACAPVGRGRLVACGWAIGRTATSPDEEPTGTERTLLINAVRWLAGDQP